MTDDSGMNCDDSVKGERIDDTNVNDVLCGRGGSINSHAGK